MPCRMNQGDDDNSLCLLFDGVDDLVGKFFRIAPTDVPAGMFLASDQGIDRQISPHLQHLTGKPRPESLELLLIPNPGLFQVEVELRENDNVPIHEENLARILSAMVSAATALAVSA